MNFVHPDDQERVRAGLLRALWAPNRSDYNLEFRILDANGNAHRVKVEGRIAFCQDDKSDAAGHCLETVDAVRQSTTVEQYGNALIEAKNAADAANRAKSEFLASVSHEIRNPMTGIMGYADILLERLKNEGDIECARTIKNSGQYLLQIVNDLLDLAKIEAQGLDLKLEEIHLPNFLTDVYTLMQGAARAKLLPLALKYEGMIPYKIESDSKRLRQILINLLSNAIKFTDEGAVELAVQFAAEAGELRFQVSDSGIGIGPEQRQNLFKPFAQGHRSTSRDYGGSGLGLTITKRLVDGLGGAIGVESSPGAGSIFRVALPVKVLLMEGHRIDGRSLTTPIAPQRKFDARVMIVEDQPDIRRLMEYFITGAGGRVAAFDRGEAALNEIKKRPDDYDIVLMDVQMPGLDGNETTRRIRAVGFTRPIIAVTAAATADDRAGCLAAGCTDYISKPIDMAELLDLIGRLVASLRPTGDRQERRQRASESAGSTRNCNPPMKVDEGKNRRRPRILLVDDRPVALHAIQILLEENGFEVRTAISGRAAVRAGGEFLPDYVFLDIDLPDMSGYEVLRQLKAHPSLPRAKFIALSGYGLEEVGRARQAGFDGYLTKPVDVAEMTRLLADWPPPAQADQPIDSSPAAFLNR